MRIHRKIYQIFTLYFVAKSCAQTGLIFINDFSFFIMVLRRFSNVISVIYHGDSSRNHDHWVNKPVLD